MTVREMNIMRGQYIPKTHTGHADEIIMGLLNEAAEILLSGYMREHAKDREMKRINSALELRGVDLLIGNEEDEGWIMGKVIAEPHTERCTSETCFCPCKYRVKINPEE